MATIHLANIDTCALLDEEDVALTEPYRWYGWKGRLRKGMQEADRPYYVAAHGLPIGNRESIKDTRPIIFLHRLILGLTKPTEFADHINGNPLDNRRANLRAPNRHGNRMNGPGWGKSGVKGVWQAANGRWSAGIRANSEGYTIGTFATLEEAMAAYDAAAREHFGEFAKTHFPEPRPFTRLDTRTLLGSGWETRRERYGPRGHTE